MKCALAAVGFLNGNIEYNKKVLADTLKKCAGKAEVVLFGESFLQGFSGIRFEPEYDRAMALSRTDPVIGKGVLPCRILRLHRKGLRLVLQLPDDP